MREPLEGYAHRIDLEFVSLIVALIHLGVVTLAATVFLWMESSLFKPKSRRSAVQHAKIEERSHT